MQTRFLRRVPKQARLQEHRRSPALLLGDGVQRAATSAVLYCSTSEDTHAMCQSQAPDGHKAAADTVAGRGQPLALVLSLHSLPQVSA